MNLYLTASDDLAMEQEFVALLRTTLGKVGIGVKVDYIQMSRNGAELVFQYGNNRVSYYADADKGFYLRVDRGTKGSITSSYLKDEVTDGVNITINWLVLQEFSSGEHVELRERRTRQILSLSSLKTNRSS